MHSCSESGGGGAVSTGGAVSVVGLDPVRVVPVGVAPVGVEPVLVEPVGVELSVSGVGAVVPVSAASSAEEPQETVASRASRPR